MKNNCCDKNNESIPLLADFLRIISEENRLKIIYLLQSGEQCVCKIWQLLELPQNLISHHLKVLRDFGLVNSRKEGLKIFYSLNKDDLNKYQEDLNKTINKRGDE